MIREAMLPETEEVSQALRLAAAPLFFGWEETMIQSALEGCMGQVVTDGKQPPKAAQIVLGDFCFFGGTPDAALVKNAKAPIMTPQNDAWSDLIARVWSDSATKATRYAIRKEGDVFDRDKLDGYVAALPQEYTLVPITAEHFDVLQGESWSADFCGQFRDAADFSARGIGVLALRDGVPVAGASSYAVYRGGIEIEIDTHPAHRRRGLATACGAQLILSCLARNLYPSWDAHDLNSVALAEKLGYHLAHPYTVYIKK